MTGKYIKNAVLYNEHIIVSSVIKLQTKLVWIRIQTEIMGNVDLTNYFTEDILGKIKGYVTVIWLITN